MRSMDFYCDHSGNHISIFIHLFTPDRSLHVALTNWNPWKYPISVQIRFPILASCGQTFFEHIFVPAWPWPLVTGQTHQNPRYAIIWHKTDSDRQIKISVLCKIPDVKPILRLDQMRRRSKPLRAPAPWGTHPAAPSDTWSRAPQVPRPPRPDRWSAKHSKPLGCDIYDL